MLRYAFIIMICILVVFVTAPRAQYEDCKLSFDIDYVGEWSETYDACHPEMKTTFDYHVVGYGGYNVIWAQVYNTSFSEVYDAATLCPSPPCTGSVVQWTHCGNLEGHALLMDVLTPSETWGFDDYKLTARYFLSKPN